jgi:biopolymer transport protein ExbB
MPTPSRPPASPLAKERAWAVLALILALGIAQFSALSPAARAQEAKKPADAAKSVPAPAAAKDEPAPKADAPATPKEAPNLLQWAWRASGYIGLFLVLLSIYFTALVIRLFLELRVSEAVPPGLVDRLEDAIKERKFQEAYDLCRDDNSYLARLVRTGVANLPNGRAEAKEAMNTLSEEIVVGMESKISYLATIGTLGPMIGLVGTIWGMIRSFQEIATAGGQPQAEKVAEGISTALFITLEGVSLSVPAIFFFAFFRNRIAQIAMESTKVADRTINAFWNAAKQPQQGAAKTQATSAL